MEMQIEECTTCEHGDTVVDVAKKIKETGTRHVYILDDNGYPVGIISTVDIATRLVAEGKDPATTKAEDIMTKEIHVVDMKEDNLDECYKVMIEKNIAACPVVEEKQLKGIVTFEEALRHLAQKAVQEGSQ